MMLHGVVLLQCSIVLDTYHK